MTTLLKAKNLTHEFAPQKGAVDINLELNSGEVVGFIGPNGAGKTTTMRMLMGLLRPASGSLEIFEDQINFFSDFPKYYSQVGFLPSEPAYYDNLTPLKMFELKEKFTNKQGVVDEAKKLSKELDLDLNRSIKKLSLGNKRKVGFILSILGSPEIVILDEPTSGLDPLIQRKALEILENMATKGTGILISSHNLAEVEYVCDRVIIIKDSKIIFTGSVKEVKANATKKVVFTFKDKAQISKLISGIDVTKQTEYQNSLEVYTKDFITLTKRIMTEGIIDFTVENPTLEEMFIDYYK